MASLLETNSWRRWLWRNEVVGEARFLCSAQHFHLGLVDPKYWALCGKSLDSWRCIQVTFALSRGHTVPLTLDTSDCGRCPSGAISALGCDSSSTHASAQVRGRCGSGFYSMQSVLSNLFKTDPCHRGGDQRMAVRVGLACHMAVVAVLDTG